jgi:phosphoglycerol transferase
LKVISRHPDPLSAVAAAALAVTGAILAQQLWRITPSVPLAYIADGQLFLAMIKATLEHGWYLNNPDLGAPLGSEWHDYPVFSGDTLHLLILHALSPISDNFVVVLHAFYLLGYALTAISAFIVLRLLETSRRPAIVCATLFALLPYHFALNEAHLFLTSYWVVPIACFLVLAVLLDRPLFARRDGSGSRLLAFASRTTLATLGACVLIGSAGGNYYSVFAAGLVLIAGVIAAIRFEWRSSLATAGVVAGTILAVVALNALPNLIYEARNGANEQVANRAPGDSELYSLTLFGILAPSPGHRIEAFDELRRDYSESSPTPVSAGATGIGTVAAVGLVWLFGFALASIVRASPWRERWRLHGAAAAAALISFLIATTGGLSLFFAHLVTPQIRVWHRFHVFIAFFALVAVAALLQLAVRRLGSAPRGRLTAGLLLAAVLVVGFLDQTNPTYVPAYDEIREEFVSDATFVGTIEDDLGPGAAVFQLPYTPFPEWWPTGRTNAFDPFRGYLHSSDLRWSYGATDARPENWQPGLIDESVAQALPRLSAARFDGIVVDRWAYPDDGFELESAIGETVDVKPLVAPNGRYSFFDLRSYGEDLRTSLAPDEIETLSSTTLRPLVAEPGPGLARPTSVPDGHFTPRFEMFGPSAQLSLVNPFPSERGATLELGLLPDAVVGLEATLPTGATAHLRPGRPSREQISLPPGTSSVALEATGDAGPGTLEVRLFDATRAPRERPLHGVSLQP